MRMTADAGQIENVLSDQLRLGEFQVWIIVDLIESGIESIDRSDELCQRIGHPIHAHFRTSKGILEQFFIIGCPIDRCNKPLFCLV